MSDYPRWAYYAEKLRIIAQAGRTYCTNPYDLERYRQLEELSAELMAENSGLDQEACREVLGVEVGYATPKVDVRAVVLQDGKMLMVRESQDGGWTLPGGWVDSGDLPHAAAEREVWEEAGFIVKAVKLLALLDHRLHNYPPYLFHIYKLFFLCELKGGEATPSLETSEVGFFGPDEIPNLSEVRTTTEIMRMMFDLAAKPDAPTVFD